MSLNYGILLTFDVQRLSVAQEKTCFNSSRGGLDDLSITPIGLIVEHNWFVCTRKALC